MIGKEDERRKTKDKRRKAKEKRKKTKDKRFYAFGVMENGGIRLKMVQLTSVL